MTYEEIMRELASLSPDGQKEVADFIAFLRERKARSRSTMPSGRVDRDLSILGFVGMWRDRQDMLESTAWVRTLREDEWTK